MNLALWLERAARKSPEAPAVAIGNTLHRTYGQSAARAAALAGALRDRLGLAPSDRVAIAAKNVPDYMEILFGLWHAGLAAVPINAKLHGAEIGWILSHADCRAAFISPDMETVLSSHVPDAVAHLFATGSSDYESLFDAPPIPAASRGPDDLAWLFYTSGTTGRPKGAMLTHRNLNWMAHAYLMEVDPTGTRRRHPPCRAAQPWLRPLFDRPCRPRRDEYRARIRRL